MPAPTFVIMMWILDMSRIHAQMQLAEEFRIYGDMDVKKMPWIFGTAHDAG